MHMWYGVLENGVFFVICDGVRGPAHEGIDTSLRGGRLVDRIRYIVMDKGVDRLVETPFPAGVDWTNGLEPME
jgi:hypothetical protein